jgi:hypothetical protein
LARAARSPSRRRSSMCRPWRSPVHVAEWRASSSLALSVDSQIHRSASTSLWYHLLGSAACRPMNSSDFSDAQSAVTRIATSRAQFRARDKRQFFHCIWLDRDSWVLASLVPLCS